MHAKHAWTSNGVSQAQVGRLMQGIIERSAMQIQAGGYFRILSRGHWINWRFRSICLSVYVSRTGVVIVTDAWIVTTGCFP
jgi:hypothetical protein